MCILAHARVSACVCVFELCHSCPWPGEQLLLQPVCQAWSRFLPGSPPLASSGCVHLNSCLVCLVLLRSLLAGVPVAQPGLCIDLLLTSQE